MAKRQTATTRTASPRATRPPQGVVESAAVFAGRTMGELVNRKDELRKQLAQVETQIAEAGAAMTKRLRQYVPKGVSGLLPTTRRKPAARKAPRRTPTPAHAHGRDRESAAAKVVEQAAASSDRTQRSARPRSAPRATRRG